MGSRNDENWRYVNRYNLIEKRELKRRLAAGKYKRWLM
jgi:hypothetical protein